jgi:hypothetical protein
MFLHASVQPLRAGCEAADLPLDAGERAEIDRVLSIQEAA